ncbi:VPLPA-CTERM sorting domain-containing protein [Pseudomonadales bacterium]|nr:VPLPA-CTERM sorting domain-containing protein [Pseudomonadales bacterium]
MNTYLLHLVACLFLCISLNSFGAPVTYQFSGEVQDNSIGFLSAPQGTPVSGSFTFDPDAWQLTCGYNCTSLIYTSDGTDENLEIKVGNLYSLYEPMTDDLHNIVISYKSGNQWQYARRIRDFSQGGDFGIAFLSINGTENYGLTSDPNFPKNIDDELYLPNHPNHLGSIIYYNNNSAMDTTGEMRFTLTSISEVPLPAGIYLFLSGLVGLGLIRGRNA